MPDNIQLSANIGTGEVAASDDVAGVQYQRIKLTDGTADSTTVIAAGGGVEANALRVTIASDSTGVVSVDDNGNSLTVDAPVGTPAFVRLSDGAAAITTLPVSIAGSLTVGLPTGASTAAKQPAIGTAGTASADVLTIQGIASMTALLVDGAGGSFPVTDSGGSLTVDGSVSVSGLIPGVTATSLGKSEDAAAQDGDTGVMMLGVRKDTAATTVGADGDYHPFEVDGSGRIWTNGSSVTQPVSGTVTANATLQAGSAAIGKLTVNTGVTIGAVEIAAAQTLATVTTVTTVGAVTAITNALPAGTNAIGKLAANTGVDIGDVDVLSIAAGTNLIGDVGIQPRTTGGLTMSKTTSAASTNATSLKASAGQVYAIQCFSVNAAVRYLKLYNKATAPTVGTDVPVKTIAIPGNTAGAGVVLAWPHGLAFGTGIAFALTTEATDAGTTGVAGSEITVNIDYK